jgi:protein-S-isoprenylcysteine O-methyltransferase Ste14
MISIGNFFFKYRNFLFIFLYVALFIPLLLPSAQLFTPEIFGDHYYLYPIIIGLVVTITGQAIRGITIGLAYIVRGGKDKKVYADALVTEGIFNHGRNPLYVGNILMLTGVGILSNFLLYICVFIPLFLFIYQAIVLAEENFLRNKFGKDFDAYCQRVNRWWINPKGLGRTIRSMKFNYKRWILKEYNTQFVWLTGIAIILLTTYNDVLFDDDRLRNILLSTVVIALGIVYLVIRYLKKSRRLVE